MNQLIRSNMRFHARRYVATGVAVLIATAFVIASLSLGNAAGASMRSVFADGYTGAAVVVGMDPDAQDADVSVENAPSIVAEIENVAGVSGASANIMGYMDLVYDGVTLGGSASALSGDFGDQNYTQGQAPTDSTEIALAAQTASALHASVGDTLQGNGKSMRLVGIFGREGSSAFDSSNEFARVTPDALDPDMSWVQNILVSSKAGPSVSYADQEQLADSINAALGAAGGSSSGLKARPVDDVVAEGLESITSDTASMNTTLLVFPLIAVVVAIIVISTTFQVVVQQRQKEMALLRCLGASTGQVRNLILGEAIMVGVVGSFLGVVIGALLSAWGIAAVGLLPGYGAALAAIGAPTAVGVFILGVVVTVLAGMRPAFRSGEIPPIAALQETTTEDRVRGAGWWVRLVVGGILALVSGWLMISSASRQNEAGLVLAMLFGAVCLISVIVFLSAVFAWLVKVAAAPYRSMLARMAAGNTLRNPGRTAATGTSIVIGVTLIVMMMVGASSLRATMNTTLDTTMPVDVEISANTGALTQDEVDALSGLGGLKETRVVQGITDATMNGENVKVLDGDTYAQVARTQIATPGQGEAFVDGNFDDGATYQLCNADACTDVKAVYKPWVGQDVFVDSQTLQQLGNPVDLVFTAQMTNTKNLQTLSADVQRISPDLQLDGAAPMRAQFESIVNIMLLVVVSLLGVSVLVALVGVSNTLSLSVAERTRENGLLRALGMTRGQVSRMITLEAIFIAVTGAIVGILLGIFFGVVGTRSIPLGIHAPTIAIPWWQIAIVVVVAILAAVIASWIPGRRAGRTSPVEALAAE